MCSFESWKTSDTEKIFRRRRASLSSTDDGNDNENDEECDNDTDNEKEKKNIGSFIDNNDNEYDEWNLSNDQNEYKNQVKTLMVPLLHFTIQLSTYVLSDRSSSALRSVLIFVFIFIIFYYNFAIFRIKI